VSIASCAVAAVAVFPNATVATSSGSLPLPVVMVSIAGAESGWVDDAAGDYGLPGPACGGYTSWGLWQIHSVHSAYLQSATGSADPCVWAAWLSVPANCAIAALAVLGVGPNLNLGAWTTYTGGQWTAHLAAAQQAVAAVTPSGGEGGGMVRLVAAVAPVAGVLFLAGVSVLAVGVGVEEERRADGVNGV